MKIVIASDIHGSYYYASAVKEAAERENADLLILLGDIYNHGPRNPLPEGYDTMKTAGVFNSVKDKLLVIKGNCDSQVDTLVSEFDFIENAVIISGGKKVFLSHGHVYNIDTPPKGNYDAVIYGHFHKAFITESEGRIYANCGSVSLPKDGNRCYLVLEDGALTLKDIYGEEITSAAL